MRYMRRLLLVLGGIFILCLIIKLVFSLFVTPTQYLKKKTSLSITPTAKMRVKNFRTSDNGMQLTYPESWFLVDTTDQEASPSADLLQSWTITDNSSGWQLQAKFAYSQTRNNLDLMKSMDCQKEVNPCQTVTVNTVPFRKTEVSEQGAIRSMYQTIKGNRLVQIEVVYTNGTSQVQMMQLWDSVFRSIRFF